MDEKMRAELERCQRRARRGRRVPPSAPMSLRALGVRAILGGDPSGNGVCEHAIKELCRVYVSRAVNCEYCGNQRRSRPGAGPVRDAVRRLLLPEIRRLTGAGEGRCSPTPRPSAGGWIPMTRSRGLEQHFSGPRKLVKLGLFHRLTTSGKTELGAASEHRASPGARRDQCLPSRRLRDPQGLASQRLGQ